MDKKITKLIDLVGSIAKLEFNPQNGGHYGLTILEPYDYDEHFGYKPPKDIYIWGKENLVKLHKAIGTLLNEVEGKELPF